MTTKQELESALKDAMRANDDLGKRTLRMALSAIRLIEVEKGAMGAIPRRMHPSLPGYPPMGLWIYKDPLIFPPLEPLQILFVYGLWIQIQELLRIKPLGQI